MNRFFRPWMPALLLALPLWAPALHAQTPAATASAATAAKTPSRGELQALEWFRMLDANGDGRISREEGAFLLKFKPSLAEEFRKADLNGDGYLTQDEIRTTADRRRAEREARRKREAQAANQPSDTLPVAARTVAPAPKTRLEASPTKPPVKPASRTPSAERSP